MSGTRVRAESEYSGERVVGLAVLVMLEAIPAGVELGAADGYPAVGTFPAIPEF